MKHKGSSFEYEQERNEDLMRAYKEQLSSCDSIVLSEIFKNVVCMPSSRFWVSEERASIVISRMMKGDKLESMRPTTREMFQEIYSRVLQIKKSCCNKTIYDIIFIVVRQQAPKFYLTPDSARVIVSRIKRKAVKNGRQLRTMLI